MTVTDTDTDSAQLLPPYSGPGLKPALLIVAIAATLLVVFVLLSAFSGTPTVPKAVTHPLVFKGTDLTGVSAASLIKTIESDGEPPPDIDGAIVVPKGTTFIGTTNTADGSGQFDSTVRCRVDGAQADVISFFRSALVYEGWTIEDHGPSSTNPLDQEVLAKKAGSDGFYWEIGAVVDPTTFAGSTDITTYSLRVFQESDEE